MKHAGGPRGRPANSPPKRTEKHNDENKNKIILTALRFALGAAIALPASTQDIIRLYGPTEGAFDGSWKPSDFEEVK